MTASDTSQLDPRGQSLARLAYAFRHDQRLFALAAAAIGFHIADDNFLQPEPGTSATGHLVSGLLPLTLALGAGAALLNTRLRAGARAAVALLVGVFGVVGGVEAAYYAHAGVTSGDDYSGILSAAGGFLLLGSGVVMLWRTRRRDDRPVSPLPAPHPDHSAVLGSAFLFLFPAALGYVVTHTARAGVRDSETRRRARERRLHDKRRSPPPGLVRTVAERCDRDRVPGPIRPAEARPHADPPRLRRAALRPPRRGRERGRPERLRLDRRPRPPRGNGIPPLPPRRRR